MHLRGRAPSNNSILTPSPTEDVATMRTVALLGGMTYGATSIYYNTINRQIQKKLGGAHSASLLLQSFDHAEMQDLFTNGQWNAVTAKFSKAATNLKAAGADGVMICCNIGHKVADEVERQSGLPLLHIADPTGQKIKDRGIRKVALIGTQQVMEDTFVSTLTSPLPTRGPIAVTSMSPSQQHHSQGLRETCDSSRLTPRPFHNSIA